MMEAAYSLMQLAKTSVKLAQLAEAKLTYISLCTDQQLAVPHLCHKLGDINIAEPGALVVLLDLGLLTQQKKIYLKVFKHQ
jgi:acetyl-CoA carboxylase carboxyl transferase subunit beta